MTHLSAGELAEDAMTLADIADARIYTPKQIARVLSVPAKRIIAAFRKGELAGIELGPRTVRITGKAVHEWLRAKEPSTNSDSSAVQAETSPTEVGVSTSKKGRGVADLALASL